jgi:SAM-dependent methyltransferase
VPSASRASFSCHACGGPVPVLDAPALNYLVGSDCTPIRGAVRVGTCENCGLLQKEISPSWQKLCDEIYGNYRIYHQAGGYEQKARSVDGGGLEPRSDLIARYLQKTGLAADTGAVLDIGCGNGGFLRAMNKHFPEWSIAGSDLNGGFCKEIEGIRPGAEFLSSRELSKARRTYDIVSFIHCIEHVPGPVEYLADVRRLIKPNGTLLIEVPDAELSPFDLVVADHSSHMFKETLAAIVEAAGYEVTACGNQVIGKEITLIARPTYRAHTRAIGASAPSATARACQKLAWLAAILDDARALADTKRPFGIFGTSIAGVWIGSALGTKIDFYVDEDKIRVGRDYFGVPIIAPSDVPSGGTVFVCLEPTLAAAIAERHRSAGHLYIVPPPVSRA